MINTFVIRKYIALIVPTLLTVILFYMGVVWYGLLIGIVFMMVGMLCGAVIGSLSLSNPFQKMLEGKGFMAFDLTSTGAITPFIVQYQAPLIFAKYKGQLVKDVFDRKAIFNLNAPISDAGKMKKITDEKTGVQYMAFALEEEQYNKSRFAMFQYPVLFYNSILKTFITKDFFSDQEKNAFAEHGILYMNRTTEELTSQVKDFGRYIVDNMKPKSSIFQNKWVWVVMIIAVIILLALFAGPLISTISSFAEGATASVASIPSNPITGR